MAVVFSKCINSMDRTIESEILRLTEQADMISFAGGLPAEQTFPRDEIIKSCELGMTEGGQKSLQYGIALGYRPLREKIAKRSNKIYKTNLNADNILVTTGSQQALDMICRLFCDSGDTVIVEKPTYLGAVMAYDLTGVNYRDVEMDSEGMRLDKLEEILKSDERVRMIYVVPDFHNPTGATWSLKRRQEFMELVNKYEIPVVEDNPYGELRFRGEHLPALKSMDEKELVLSCGTFSKTFAPGMRVGWIAARKAFIDKMEGLKVSMDLSSSPFVMRLVDAWLENFDYDAHLDIIKALYKKRCDAMLAALDEMMPEGFTYTRPEGGLFCWVTMPKHMDSMEVLKESVKDKVAFIPGQLFFTSSGNNNYFRLNYSYCDEDTIREGVKRLTNVLKRMK